MIIGLTIGTLQHTVFMCRVTLSLILGTSEQTVLLLYCKCFLSLGSYEGIRPVAVQRAVKVFVLYVWAAAGRLYRKLQSMRSGNEVQEEAWVLIKATLDIVIADGVCQELLLTQHDYNLIFIGSPSICLICTPDTWIACHSWLHSQKSCPTCFMVCTLQAEYG